MYIKIISITLPTNHVNTNVKDFGYPPKLTHTNKNDSTVVCENVYNTYGEFLLSNFFDKVMLTFLFKNIIKNLIQLKGKQQFLTTFLSKFQSLCRLLCVRDTTQ